MSLKRSMNLPDSLAATTEREERGQRETGAVRMVQGRKVIKRGEGEGAEGVKTLTCAADVHAGEEADEANEEPEDAARPEVGDARHDCGGGGYENKGMWSARPRACRVGESGATCEARD